jgi:hypothetical protein
VPCQLPQSKQDEAADQGPEHEIAGRSNSIQTAVKVNLPIAILI